MESVLTLGGSSRHCSLKVTSLNVSSRSSWIYMVDG